MPVARAFEERFLGRVYRFCFSEQRPAAKVVNWREDEASMLCRVKHLLTPLWLAQAWLALV